MMPLGFEREIALDTLLEITEEKVFSHVALNQQLSVLREEEKRSRALISHLVSGTLEHLIEMDYIINLYSKVPTSKMKPLIRNLLRLSVYQLIYMDRIHPAAVCNEAVKLAKKRGFQSLSGFINGVLRTVTRNIETLPYPKDHVARMEVLYSVPAWIIKTFLKIYRRDTVEEILKSFGERKRLTIRVNISKISIEELKHSLEDEGVTVDYHPYLDYALIIDGVNSLERLHAFHEGDFYVQDISSMLVGELSGVKEGSFCLDLCAAPGGKTIHLADLLKGGGKIEARDVSATKVTLLEENVKRSGFTNIEVDRADARVLVSKWVNTADLVLADVPCSGLGILGRKPDLRYNIQNKDIGELVSLQRDILGNACQYVKPGGILMFSTCTINPKENQRNVRWILDKYKDLELINLSRRLPRKLQGSVDKGCLQLLPGVHLSDGFFIAKFRKKTRMRQVLSLKNKDI